MISSKFKSFSLKYLANCFPAELAYSSPVSDKGGSSFISHSDAISFLTLSIRSACLIIEK